MSGQQRIDELGDDHGNPLELTLDAGIASRDRMVAKHEHRLGSIARLKRIIFWTMTFVLIVIITIIAAVGYYGYNTRKGGYLSYDRPCTVTKNGVKVDGVRTFGQPYHDYFGIYRYSDKSELNVKTTFTLTGSKTEVVGFDGDKTWWKSASDGEFGNLPIEHASQYAVMIGAKQRVIFTDSEFCK